MPRTMNSNSDSSTVRPPTSALLARMTSRTLSSGDAEVAQPLRVDDHVVLLDEAADAGDFGDAFGLGEAIAQGPVLHASAFGEVLVLR